MNLHKLMQLIYTKMNITKINTENNELREVIQK